MIIATNSGSLVPNFTSFPFQRLIWIRIDFRFCWVQIGLQTLLGIFEHSNLEIGEAGGIDGGYRVQCESHLRMLSDVSWFTLFLWISSFKHVFSGQICADGISIIPRGTTCKGRIEFAVPEEFLAGQMSVCYHGWYLCKSPPNSRASFAKRKGWNFHQLNMLQEFCFSLKWPWEYPPVISS